LKKEFPKGTTLHGKRKSHKKLKVMEHGPVREKAFKGEPDAGNQ